METTLPVRFVATTLNLWKDDRWPEREQALRKYIKVSKPDILCVQELRLPTRQVIDEELSGHQRVEDAFPGWSGESNIYWNTELFTLLGYGTERIKEDEPEILRNRHLFWVRLAVKSQERTLFVATAHYTPASMPKEREDGQNPRLAEARKTILALDRLLTADEACLFMGDLNDALLPIRILRASGLQDSFTASGTPPRPTHPAIPTGRGMLPQLLDWQLHRGPLRVMNTTVVDFFSADFAPSDHKPVSTTYAFV